MIITLLTGDWSGDGHRETDAFVFEVNSTLEVIKQAYKDGAKKCGVDITKYCRDYQQGCIPDEVYEKLKEHQLLPNSLDGYRYLIEMGEPELRLGPHSYSAIWVNITKLGNPSLSFEPAEDRSVITIGGYGLY